MINSNNKYLPHLHINIKKSSPTSSIERQSFSSSSSSPLPTQIQQSFTLDTSIIDRNWLEQQHIHDTNTHCILPSACHDHSNTKQLSNHEVKQLIKHVSQALSTTNTSSTTSTSPPSSSSSNLMKTIIERLRAKSSNELLRSLSLLDNTLLQQSESSNTTTTNIPLQNRPYPSESIRLPFDEEAHLHRLINAQNELLRKYENEIIHNRQ
ncbi:unnamed protein product [Rotaria sordida]|uniref:Uncharacterized protein n=1 Tax=Rotaria sordida TaxID=392033 RepID=A0A814BTP1_9BILA|nr:unnamed protein product [Rotaria sordida]